MKKYFQDYSDIEAVLSEREDGSMKLLESGENDGNRERFFEKIGVNSRAVVSADLVNGNNVAIVGAKSSRVVDDVDALVTADKSIFLSITVADCVPVFFYEPRKEILAISHCGWRGVVGNIIDKTIGKIEELGGDSGNLQVALGPGINVCHFEIKEDILGEFENYKEFITSRENKLFVDLKGIVKKQLISRGIEKENIENDSECTFESKKYFSYRRDKPKEVEAMMATIGKIQRN